MVDTDDEEIAHEARRWGAEVPFLRDASLARDETSTVDSTLGAIDRLAAGGREFDVLVLLQPTSPLRTVEDVVRCWEAFESAGRTSVTSISALSHPAELLVRRSENGALQWRDENAAWQRRQDASPSYRLTGAVYIIATRLLRDEQRFVIDDVTRGVVLDPVRSIDVDAESDLEAAEAVLARRRTPAIPLGGARIGGGARCFVIAEAGVNHNGDAALAHRLVDVAADAGADAVKFQTFDPEKLVAPRARKAEYQSQRTGADESQLDMLGRLVLTRADFVALASHAAERSIQFLSTAFDETSADFLEELGVAAFKLPSGELTNHAFLAHLARKGRPLLVSTGMSTMTEVEAAVRVVHCNGDPPLALFHCVTSYPAAPADCNLGAMETMRRAFGVPVGWSDHTLGLSVSVASVALGAELLEKHFTLDREMPGPDHAASLEPNELKSLVRALRDVEAARGSGAKVPTVGELANATAARRSLHARRDLPSGHVIGNDDLVALRPGNGFPPYDYTHLLGRVVRVPLREGEMLREEHFA
jgi:N-acetylneuraminate synthase